MHEVESPLLGCLKKSPGEMVRSRKCSSTDDEEEYTFKNVSYFTAEGSPTKMKRI